MRRTQSCQFELQVVHRLGIGRLATPTSSRHNVDHSFTDICAEQDGENGLSGEDKIAIAPRVKQGFANLFSDKQLIDNDPYVLLRSIRLPPPAPIPLMCRY